MIYDGDEIEYDPYYHKFNDNVPTYDEDEFY